MDISICWMLSEMKSEFYISFSWHAILIPQTTFVLWAFWKLGLTVMKTICITLSWSFLCFILRFAFFQVVGISLIGVGSWVLANSEDYSYWFKDADTISVVSGFVIGIGCIIFFIGFCGCYGAISKQVCFLYIVRISIVKALSNVTSTFKK